MLDTLARHTIALHDTAEGRHVAERDWAERLKGVWSLLIIFVTEVNAKWAKIAVKTTKKLLKKTIKKNFKEEK